MSSSRPDADSMRPAKESKGGEVGERRWRRIQWSGLTDGGFPNPSMHSYGKLRRRRSQLSAFCLLSNPTRRGGNKKKKEKRGKCVDGMWGWGRDTDGVSRGHIFDFALYFVHAPSVLPLTPSPHMHNLLCADWHRQARIQFIAILWNPPPPPRGKGSGGVPSKHVPSPTYFALPSCFVRVSNKTDGQEKKMEKRGKKEYRLAFRAPRGPLSSIRSERAANHQSCYFSLSLSPSVPVSLQGPLSMKRAI